MDKSDGFKNMMRSLGFNKQIDRVEAGLCAFCAKPVKDEDFEDALSRKEYAISGIGQCCQAAAFSPPKED